MTLNLSSLFEMHIAGLSSSYTLPFHYKGRIFEQDVFGRNIELMNMLSIDCTLLKQSSTVLKQNAN